MIGQRCCRPLACFMFVGALLAASCWAAGAQAATKVYLIAVGVNSPVPTPGTRLSTLRYADDDAAAVFEFLKPATQGAHLLTMMDAQTQALYPDVVRRSRAPSLEGIDAAVRDVATHIRRDRSAGYTTTAIVFFSGHGTLSERGEPALLLADARLTRPVLYNRILERLPADVVHLWVDACHAEAVVRPRDVTAPVVGVSPLEAHEYLVKSTLARFPQVGSLVAATTDREAHEWDVVSHGVFTYELLSALRGAADVNRDRAIEYSEVSAYMAAANRGVANPGVRLQVVARAPPIDRRAPLVDLSTFPTNDAAWLLRIPDKAGLVEISDSQGKRLASVHTSSDFAADILLPARGMLYVRSGGLERRWSPKPGERASFDSLSADPITSRPRGSANDALRQGLFSVAYGRGYYLGFTDQREDFVPVSFAGNDAGFTDDEQGLAGTAPPSESLVTLTASFGLGPVIAEELEVASGVQLGARFSRSSGLVATAEVMQAREADLSEWRSEAALGYLWALNSGRARAWLGGTAGGGVIHQSSTDVGSRESGVFSVRPMVGWSVDITERFSSWTAIEYGARGYLQDGSVTFDFAPSAWLGAGGAL